MRKTFWRVGALSLIAACQGSPTTDTENGPGARFNVTENGVVETPVVPDSMPLSPSPSPDWIALRVDPVQPPTYLPTDGRTPDLSYYVFGRSDRQFPTMSTPVGIRLAGLDWKQGDSLQLVSPNAGLSIHELQSQFDYPPEASQSVAQSMDWAHVSAPLVEGDKGDTTYVAEMSSVKMKSGAFYSVITRSGVSTVNMRDGVAATLDATLAPVVPDKTLAFHWAGSAYAALAKEMGPGARPGPAPALAIRTLPDVLVQNNNFQERMYMYLPSLVDFGPVRGSQDFDEVIAYGNPFAAKTKWTDFVSLVYAMPVRVPGAGIVNAMVVQATPVDGLDHGALSPALSPVRNVQINGLDLATPQAGVGGEPVIAWDAPALGTATSYAVTIHQIVSTAGHTSLQRAGTFMTQATSLKLPVFATKAGSAYVLRITAISAPGRELAHKPLVTTIPYASTDYVTAQITP